jgi:hypothetical protein
MVRKYGQLLRKNCFWLTQSRHVTSGNRCCTNNRRYDSNILNSQVHYPNKVKDHMIKALINSITGMVE